MCVGGLQMCGNRLQTPHIPSTPMWSPSTEVSSCSTQLCTPSAAIQNHAAVFYLQRKSGGMDSNSPIVPWLLQIHCLSLVACNSYNQTLDHSRGRINLCTSQLVHSGGTFVSRGAGVCIGRFLLTIVNTCQRGSALFAHVSVALRYTCCPPRQSLCVLQSIHNARYRSVHVCSPSAHSCSPSACHPAMHEKRSTH